MLMMDENDRARPWWSILYTLIERALLTFERAPGVFVKAAVLFYLPLAVWDVAERWVQLSGWISWAVTPALWAAVIVMCASVATRAAGIVRQGGRPTLGEAMRAVTSNFVPMAMTTIVSALLIVVGSLLFVVPAAIFTFWILFAGPATSEEGKGPGDAIKRSRTLVGEGRWIQIAGILALALLLKLLAFMVPLALYRVFLLLSHSNALWKDILMAVAGWIVDIGLISILSAWIGVAWYDILDAIAYGEKTRAQTTKKRRVE